MSTTTECGFGHPARNLRPDKALVAEFSPNTLFQGFFSGRSSRKPARNRLQGGRFR
jgi:hypothetical protein